MIIAKIGPKAQATIPAAIRRHMNLKEGDTIEFQIQPEGDVVLKLVPKQGEVAEDPFAFFTEWSSQEDEQAFADFR